MHNAHRANVPVFVIAGMAPVTDQGYPGSRDHPVHYFQDVFDQPGIVREYCRWFGEYRPPAAPDVLVSRALDRATGDPPGPVYLTATREALETEVGDRKRERSPPKTRPTSPDATTIASLAERITDARHPLVITSRYDGETDAIVEFAETAGAAVIEQTPTRLSFPRDHGLHAGFDPTTAFELADLVLVVASDVPWVPAQGSPTEGTSVIQLDTTPTKPAYPHWDFPITERVPATPKTTLQALTERLDPGDGESGRTTWRTFADERRAELEERLVEDRAADRLTPAVLSDALTDVLDETAIVIEDAVTSRPAIMNHLALTGEQAYYWKGGAGLGWAGGAGVGAKVAHPERQVVSLVGDGAYLFANPAAYTLFAATLGAPTLTVIYNNAGWKAVSTATQQEHPRGAAVDAGVPLSQFDPVPDLSAPAKVVDAYTATVDEIEGLTAVLDAGAAAVEEGRPAVVDVRVEGRGG